MNGNEVPGTSAVLVTVITEQVDTHSLDEPPPLPSLQPYCYKTPHDTKTFKGSSALYFSVCNKTIKDVFAMAIGASGLSFDLQKNAGGRSH